MTDHIKLLFITKSGKLNNNYKLIFNKQSQFDQERILSLYTMYDDLGDKLKSVIENDYRHCPVCDEPMSWKDKNKTCSKECAKISLVENQEKTNLERYGVRNAAQSEEFQLKMQQTNLERYGVTHPLKNKNSLDKMQQTNLERYGVSWVSQNEDVWEKQRQSCIEKYGTEYAAQNKDIQNKNKETNLERYGVEYPLQVSEFNKKTQNQIILNKIEYIYDKVGILLTEKEINKIVLDARIEYDKEYILQLVNYAKFDIKPDFELIKNEYDDTRYYYVAKNYGYEFDNVSLAEKEIESFLNDHNITHLRNDRKNIYPYELDFYIPKSNLAIEFNGGYWHSDKFKDKHYHQNKTKMCNEKGITLIHIHEHLFNTSKNIYFSIIKSKLNLNTKIYARKCVIKEVPTNIEREFLNTYHLQGYTASKYSYGLYYGDELVSLCTFGKSRFNKNYEYELIRNCTKENISVIGGLSKFIKHFKNITQDKPIICYSDASISYNKGGELSKPNYIWFSNKKVLKRYNTMKHKLPDLLGDAFDDSLSESENMKKCGYHRVYDSGNYITII